MVATLKPGDLLSVVKHRVSTDKMVEFEQVIWDRGRNAHSDAGEAKKDGLARPLASGQNQMAFIHEMLEKNFGDGWVYGGRISVRYICPVYDGDELTAGGAVVEVEDGAGTAKLTLDVWCENQEGQKTAAGRAYVGRPQVPGTWLTADQGARV